MMNFYSKVPTELHLNGPNVKISTNPVNVTANLAGLATFTAISTATFPYNETNGTFNFQWYFDGNKINDTSVDSSSNASIESSSAGITTFTLNGINGNDNQKPIFVVATYNPGPDENIIDYPAEGINKATSSTAVLTVPPSIVITKQPSTVLIGSGNTAEFSIDAEISPSANVPISYTWELEGSELTNGTTTRTVQISDGTLPTMTVTSDADDNFTLNWNELTTFNGFVTGRTYTLTASDDLETKLVATGAGGGTSDGRSVSGGAGGESTGTFTFVKDQTYKLNVGQAGANAGAGGFSGGGNGGGGEGLGGGGGGYTGLFSDSITIGNSVIIAGGGGGGANDPAAGGSGGGLTGGAGGNAPGRGGEGGTQTAGGGGGQDNGAALQGGPGAAGGGGGYYGGAGGNPHPTCCADGAGGGGSGYIGGVTDGTTTNGTGAEASQDGSFSISKVTLTKEVTITVSGAGTKNLKIFSDDDEYGGALKCVLSASGVLNSPLESNIVSYDVTYARPLVQFEGYSFDNKYIALEPIDLDVSEYTVTDSTFGSDYGIIQFHLVEIDTTIQLDVKASAGADSSLTGGEGGTSIFKFLARRNVEYTVIGISNNSAVFIYEKSQLIAVVGKGGNAGTNGRGGAGGGVRSDGAIGKGSGAGDGGTVPSLQVSNGVFGSVVEDYATIPTVYTGDSIAEAPNGGLTITCSRGSYWADQGIAACSDISSGEIQFNNIDGTRITESSSLYRGFKPGYTISETSGKTLDPTNGGNGGAGAAGGDGSTNNGGGGGGAGYNSGSIDISSSTLGGNTTKKSSINFSLPSEIPPVPPSVKTKTGIFTHDFDPGAILGPGQGTRVASTTYINFNGAIADAQIVAPALPPSGIERFGNSRNNYFVIITMNDLYSSITVELLQDRQAVGGEGPEGILLTKVENMGGGRRWGVWFNLPPIENLPVGFSVLARQWRVTGGPLGTPPNPGAAYPASQSWSRTAVNRRRGDPN